jgi:plasmid stabilization system protein ParE
MVNLKISPKAQKDMLEIKEYISEELGNPTAQRMCWPKSPNDSEILWSSR